VEKIHPLGKITDYEKTLLEKALPELENNITTVSVSHVVDQGVED
jgi:hypothetical protein